MLFAGQSFGQGYTPEEAARKMAAPPGFDVRLIAAEPLVRQPVAIDFDDRGRLWVVQYLQYPNPAGLKRVSVDRYSRTRYDRVPEPPPKGPKGADRITILESTGAAGRMDKAKDFVKDLNLCTGFAFGHGGVFVLQVPYLLFYPDRDHDGVPDGDPQVLLEGFGMEDAHSVANSLTWGPDGWLYGCQGSTVTANIRGIVFQQGVWRYHPLTHKFELFCDGGGNSWGLDFDPYGNLFYSTNFGGFTMLHGVQGGYYWKQFDKHGAFQNPFTFGYFDHVPHKNFRGGHVTVGGIIYQGEAFPLSFRGKYVAADLLGHAVYWHHIEPHGSSFQSSHGGDLLQANDTSFAPSDVTMGPDGAIYLADWHDKRMAHPDPDADWDRSTGRIFRVQHQTAKSAPFVELANLPSERLVAMLSHSNDWYVRRARRMLAERRDPTVVAPLRQMVLRSKQEPLGLQALWALYVSGGFKEEFAEKLLEHPNPHVRRWTVRFLGDEDKISTSIARLLVQRAISDTDVSVRSQLASTARRLPGEQGLPIVQELLRHAADVNDPHLPLLLWWAVERHALTSRDQVVAMFASATAWKQPLSREAILGRLMRRYAAENSGSGWTACAALLNSAPDGADRRLMLASLDQGLQERPGLPAAQAKGSLFTKLAVVDSTQSSDVRRPAKMPAPLVRSLAGDWSDGTTDVMLLRLFARLGHEPARQRALALASKNDTPEPLRLAMLTLIGELGQPEAVPLCLRLLEMPEPEAVQLAALSVLQRFDRTDIAVAVLRRYSTFSPRLRTRSVETLLGRKAWALALVRAVESGQVPAQDIGVEQLRLLALHQDPELNALTRKHWGSVARGTPEEKLAEMRRLSNDLRAGSGDINAGRLAFKKHCATCHQIFGEGEKLGPDLTHANRQDREFLLQSLVDPSAVIRKEYLTQVLQTADGRLLTGLIVAQANGQVTLANAKNERVSLALNQIESIRESPVSLMPEDLHKQIRPQELRDLFTYLQSSGK